MGISFKKKKDDVDYVKPVNLPLPWWGWVIFFIGVVIMIIAVLYDKIS